MSVRAEHWVFHRKTAVQEITHDRRNVHTNSSALFIPSLLLVWGLDQSMDCGPAALALPGSWLETQNLRLCPRPTGSESAFQRDSGSMCTLQFEKPRRRALTNSSLLVDGTVYFLTSISGIRCLHA